MRNISRMYIMMGRTHNVQALPITFGYKAAVWADELERCIQRLEQSRERVLALHASSRATSNTLALWGRVREALEPGCQVTEIGLRNGTLEDCAGCAYTTCLHFGEQGDCFYGGVMVREVFPAIREADAVMLICPNYNDALSANLTAAVNRLTALYRTTSFEDKAVFAIVVASQVVSALCVNKGFWLPPRAILLETANDAGAAMRLPGIEERLLRFAGGISANLIAGPTHPPFSLFLP